MSLRPLSCVTLVVGLSVVSSPAHSQTLQRGVLIDPEHAQVLVMLPEGGIEAVALDDGGQRWRSKQADMPMAISGGGVLALAGPAKRGLIHYAFLDRVDGSVRGSHYAALPAPARALVDDRLGERFEIKSQADLLHWEYRHSAVTGALLVSGAGPLHDADASAPASKESTSVVLRGALRIDAKNSKLAAADGTTATTKSLPVEIGLPQPGQPRRFRSMDGEHVLVSAEQAGGGYRWRIEDAKGQRLGGFDIDWSYLPFLVVDDAALFVQPLGLRFDGGQAQIDFPTLVAMDLAAGTPRWRKEIRDTEFRGPFPP